MSLHNIICPMCSCQTTCHECGDPDVISIMRDHPDTKRLDFMLKHDGLWKPLGGRSAISYRDKDGRRKTSSYCDDPRAAIDEAMERMEK